MIIMIIPLINLDLTMGKLMSRDESMKREKVKFFLYLKREREMTLQMDLYDDSLLSFLRKSIIIRLMMQ
jgi:hypothetical protein